MAGRKCRREALAHVRKNSPDIHRFLVLLMCGRPVRIGRDADRKCHRHGVAQCVLRDFQQDLSPRRQKSRARSRAGEHRVCPVVMGQNPHFTAFITQHIKWSRAWRPARPSIPRRPGAANVEIVFTTATPQNLQFDNVRKNDPDYLGYAASGAQREALATVTRPIQAWYATETTDDRRAEAIWTPAGRSSMATTSRTWAAGPAGDNLTAVPGNIQDLPPFYASTGNHLNDGIHTGFRHILIVIDSAKLAGQEIVPSPIISPCVRARPGQLAGCVPGSAQRREQAGAGLRPCRGRLDPVRPRLSPGPLYHMTTGRTMAVQRAEIGDLMTDRLEKAK